MSKLWEALDSIRERGMIKFSRRGLAPDGRPSHCALGHLDRVYGLDSASWVEEHPDGLLDLERVAAAMLEIAPERATNHRSTVDIVASWNNHAATTQADLELAFEKAAIKADEVLGAS